MFTLKFAEKNMENKERVFLLEGGAIGGLWVPERLKGKPAKSKGMMKLSATYISLRTRSARC